MAQLLNSSALRPKVKLLQGSSRARPPKGARGSILGQNASQVHQSGRAFGRAGGAGAEEETKARPRRAPRRPERRSVPCAAA